MGEGQEASQDICLPEPKGGLQGPLLCGTLPKCFRSAAWPHLQSEDPVLENLSMHPPKASEESPLSGICLASIPKDGWVKREKPAFEREGA